MAASAIPLPEISFRLERIANAQGADRAIAAAAADLVAQRGCLGRQPIRTVRSGNSTELATRSQTILREVAAGLQRHPDIAFEVAGHTDSSGDPGVNLAVSAERARAVRQFLVAAGVDGARLKVRGYGEEKPIADNATANGRALKCRVSLIRLR